MPVKTYRQAINEAMAQEMRRDETVIVIGEKGRWQMDPAMVERTRAGRETYLKMGAKLAAAS